MFGRVELSNHGGAVSYTASHLFCEIQTTSRGTRAYCTSCSPYRTDSTVQQWPTWPVKVLCCLRNSMDASSFLLGACILGPLHTGLLCVYSLLLFLLFVVVLLSVLPSLYCCFLPCPVASLPLARPAACRCLARMSLCSKHPTTFTFFLRLLLLSR
ncbi:hypothetical protein BGZ63DRAFT_149936 [Mariannaea sp. PMI_226]|nr:hypothetical protein BGZ63DRAFT_149936 [Mariannaea sp. PMI_226]